MTDSPIIEAYKYWSPEAQQEAIERLKAARTRPWKPFYCKDRYCDGKPHDQWTWNHARADQRPPRDPNWLVWLLLSGRGAGKTRSGAEYSHRMTERTGRIALVAATGADVRDIMLEGESGILTISPPGGRPKYEPSKRRLTWPNGCVATTFSAEEPDRLRGPEHGFAWVDEAAFYPLVQDVWDNLMFGLRIGAHPRCVVTTTPKPRPWLKALKKDPRTRVSTASTYDNLDNLAPTFAEMIISKYEGTRLGRQEIYAEILEDVEGALWNMALIDARRLQRPPSKDDLSRIVVAIDPAGSSRKQADETGIVVAGRWGDQYVPLEDLSGHHTPKGWFDVVVSAYDRWEADAVVAETNYGAEMVEELFRLQGYEGRLIKVRAKKGKAVRAEPIVGLYQQGKVWHPPGLAMLEQQMCEWVPYDPTNHDSPDRLDALVYALTILAYRPGQASLASPVDLDLTLPAIGAPA